MDFESIENLSEEEIEKWYYDLMGIDNAYIVYCWCNKTPNTYYYDSQVFPLCSFGVMNGFDCDALCRTRPDEWRFVRWFGGHMDARDGCYCDHLRKNVGGWARQNCPFG